MSIKAFARRATVKSTGRKFAFLTVEGYTGDVICRPEVDGFDDLHFHKCRNNVLSVNLEQVDFGKFKVTAIRGLAQNRAPLCADTEKRTVVDCRITKVEDIATGVAVYEVLGEKELYASLAAARTGTGREIKHPLPKNGGRKTNDPALSQRMAGAKAS